RGQRGVVAVLLNPWQQLPVCEANAEVTAHRNFALEADDDPDEVVLRAGGHEIDDPYTAALAHEVSLEYHGLWLVMLVDGAHPRGGSYRPVAVLVGSKELRETRIRVDAWQAHPVDGAVA